MNVTILAASSRNLLRAFRQHVLACKVCGMGGGEDARPFELCLLGVTLRQAYIATSKACILETEIIEAAAETADHNHNHEGVNDE